LYTDFGQALLLRRTPRAPKRLFVKGLQRVAFRPP